MVKPDLDGNVERKSILSLAHNKTQFNIIENIH